MSMIMNRAPAREPVSLEEIKAALGLSGGHEDTLLSCLLVAARMVCEHRTGLVFIDQEWSFFLDQWPASGIVKAPVAPVRTVNAVKVHDWHDGAVDLSLDLFDADAGPYPAYIHFKRDRVPAPRRAYDSIEFAVTAGLAETADQVPRPIRQAILELASEWFVAREPVAFGHGDIPIAEPISKLLAPYRYATVH